MSGILRPFVPVCVAGINNLEMSPDGTKFLVTTTNGV
jgi:hypothetical protein